jgi:restriction endonuclease
MSGLLLDRLSPREFEEFVHRLIEAMNFEGVTYWGGPADEGKDIVAYQPSAPPVIKPATRKWIFQCKRSPRITKAEIMAELSNFASENIDTWVLVTTARPSTQLREWLLALDASIKYHFHIEAWWKEDVEKLTREYGKVLLNSLPSKTLELLDFHNELRLTDSWTVEAVAARCRDVVNAQIDRFAKNKYIPNLYIQRKLEGRLIAFHGAEAELARTLKTEIIHTIRKEISQLENYLKAFPLKGTNRERDHEHPAIRNAQPKEFKKEVRFVNRLFVKSELWIDNLKKALMGLSKTARALSDVSYIEKAAEHDFLCREIERIVVLLNSMPTVEHEIKFGHSPEVLNRKVGLIPMNRILNQIDRLKNLSNYIQRFRRNSLLVVDRAGSGKTSLICDLALQLATKYPVVILFGKETFIGPEGMIHKLEEIISRSLETERSDGMTLLDRLLEQEGVFLHVFLEGINESRNIGEMDVAIACFLDWAKEHRIRVTVTCRDIYWVFFNYDNWKQYVDQMIQGGLGEFSPEEYKSALPLYLSHYKIRCELADDARIACQHPLLLRFFCEAYGTVNGSEVILGIVRDIRLKELFDEYFNRKVEQIRHFLRHGNEQSVVDYMSKLIAYMFRNLSTSIFSTEISDATGDADLSTERSLYLRLLDEDIIIEEQPTDIINKRRVTFVYEEFMEYMLARTLLAMPSKFGLTTVGDIFRKLDSSIDRWINARGVGEYVGLMLLEGDFNYPRSEAIDFLRNLGQGGTAWPTAFWSVVGKCSGQHLLPDLFDLFAGTLMASPNMRVARNAVSAMARYNQDGAKLLSHVLLWSIALPQAILWTEFYQLPGISMRKLNQIRDRLVTATVARIPFSAVEGFSYADLIDLISPYIDEAANLQINKAMRVYGAPSGREPIGKNLIQVIWKSFPTYHPMLLNGLFSQDRGTRIVCADRIRFAKSCVAEIAYLCKHIAKAEGLRKWGKYSQGLPES